MMTAEDNVDNYLENPEAKAFYLKYFPTAGFSVEWEKFYPALKDEFFPRFNLEDSPGMEAALLELIDKDHSMTLELPELNEFFD